MKITSHKSEAGFIPAQATRLRSLQGWSKLLHSSMTYASLPFGPPGFDPRSGNVGLMVGEVTVGWIFSKYFDFLWQFSLHQQLHLHYSSYHGHYITSILTVSLNNQRKKTQDFLNIYGNGWLIYDTISERSKHEMAEGIVLWSVLLTNIYIVRTDK
jgi:hypothetical protein